MPPSVPPPVPPSVPPPFPPPHASRGGQAITLASSAGLLVSVFLPWADPVLRGLHTPWTGQDGSPVTVGLALVALAALAVIAALAGDRGWPRVAVAVGAASMVVIHLDGWQAVSLPAGAWVVVAAAVGNLTGAVLATARPAHHRLGRAPAGTGRLG